MIDFIYVIIFQRFGWYVSEIFFFPQHKIQHETNLKYSVEVL